MLTVDTGDVPRFPLYPRSIRTTIDIGSPTEGVCLP